MQKRFYGEMSEISQTHSQPQNPYPYYQQMRERQPVFYDQEQQMWQVFRYADVERVYTDYPTFSSQTACCPITTQFHSFYRMEDPPDLQRYRSLVSFPFTPLAVERLIDRVTATHQNLAPCCYPLILATFERPLVCPTFPE